MAGCQADHRATEPDSSMSDSETTLEFTGERFTPECVREIWYEHWHRYAFAAGLVRGARVLDLACGEGYGSFLLADQAGHVTGVDISQQAVDHARTRYQRDNLEFAVGSAADIPLEDDSFDRVVSFETLEHLAEQEEMLAEFRRVLRPDGLLIISSPDRAVYSDQAGYQNEFHVRELYRDELETLLAREFPAVRLLGQKLMFHSSVWPLDGKGATAQMLTLEDGNGRVSTEPAAAPMYFIALCAARADLLPAVPSLQLFADQAESVYQHYYHEIRKNMSAGEIIQQRDQEIERLKRELERCNPEQADRG